MLKLRDLVCKNSDCDRKGNTVRDVMVEVIAGKEVVEICKSCRGELAHALSPNRYNRGGNGNADLPKPPTESNEMAKCCSDAHRLNISIAPVPQNEQGVVGALMECGSGKVVGLVHKSGQIAVAGKALEDQIDRDHAEKAKSRN